jgi:hypothetical protein
MAPFGVVSTWTGSTLEFLSLRNKRGIQTIVQNHRLGKVFCEHQLDCIISFNLQADDCLIQGLLFKSLPATHSLDKFDLVCSVGSVKRRLHQASGPRSLRALPVFSALVLPYIWAAIEADNGKRRHTPSRLGRINQPQVIGSMRLQKRRTYRSSDNVVNENLQIGVRVSSREVAVGRESQEPALIADRRLEVSVGNAKGGVNG